MHDVLDLGLRFSLVWLLYLSLILHENTCKLGLAAEMLCPAVVVKYF